MKIREIIGIDVSKLTVDVFIYSTKDKACFDNTIKGLNKLIKWVFSTSDYPKEEVFFVFEHTGIYAEHLTHILSKRQLYYSVISGLEIKKSLGITRGKEDSIDAQRIALYGYRLREELKADQPVDIVIKKLKTLSTLRKRMVRERAGYTTSLKEQKRILSSKDYRVVFSVQTRMIKMLSKEIETIELEIKTLINQDIELKKTLQLDS